MVCQAVPHVSGIIAALIATRGEMSPGVMKDEINKLAVKNKLVPGMRYILSK